jgi:hypothetical protein
VCQKVANVDVTKNTFGFNAQIIWRFGYAPNELNGCFSCN